MSDSPQLEEIVVYNERSLRKLIRSITNSQGHFALIIARCNYQSLREQVIQQLKAECPVEIQELHLPTTVKTLYTTIAARLAGQSPPALMVFGLDLIEDIDQFLISTNQVREEFRKNFLFPIVIWINDEILQKLVRFMPDFKSWTGNSIQFKTTTHELLLNLRQTTTSVLATMLNFGVSNFFGNMPLSLDSNAINLSEIKDAIKRLQIIGEELEPDLAASVQFLLGREADISGDKSTARNYYEQSLAVWEQKVKNQESISDNVSFNDLKCYGYLLWCLGLWWRQFAISHIKQQRESYLKAKEYFQKCVELFQQYDYPDLAAQVINDWGEVLSKLKDGNELEKVAELAIKLHETYPNPRRLAYSYGLMAEVLLDKSQWTEAKKYAESALRMNDTPAMTTDASLAHKYYHSLYRNLYLLLIAKAQKNLNQPGEAIANLVTARRESNPQYDPLLYIEILETLRSLYFEQGKYLEAFEVKLERRSLEQQYGLRAFVGAGRLKSQLQVINPILTQTEAKVPVSPEIAESGRMQDVDRLIERLSRNDHKLTVIYGQSGVGKSSLVEAGLLPALKGKAIDARNVVPVLLQVYTDWAKDLSNKFIASLTELGRLNLPELIDPITDFIEELQKNIEKNLLTVLIFDQFEEFFFAYKDSTTRKPFFDFISDCLNTPYVKVILALREDYLHYLLECNRLTHLNIIDNNILDKKILYYLGNFSPKDTHSVIQRLTKSSQLDLEPPLIEELVRDLAGVLQEVRPIELQVVGAQLETEQITKLVQYQEYGPKEKLVGRFLEEVIKDCGSNNQQFAKLILYLLTDENNTRPLKTRAELESALALESSRWDLIFKILVKSGLVFQVPGFPAERYQLVHDYLVPFVREQQSASLIAELEKEKEQRKLTEAKLIQVTKQQLKTARRQNLTLAGLLVSIIGIATVAAINHYLISLSNYAKDDSGFKELVSAIAVGKKLKNFSIFTFPEVKLRVISKLSHAIQSDKEINSIQGFNQDITALSFSKNHKILAVVTKDGVTQLFSVPDGNPIKKLPGNSDITSVSFSPTNENILATASKDGTAKIWSITGGKVMQTLKGHTKGLTFITFSPDGQRLATASEDKTVKIWNLAGKPIHTLSVNSGKGEIVSFSPDKKMVATGGQFDKVRLWNLEAKNYQPHTIDNYGAINLNFANDGSSISIFNRDNTLSVWSTLTTKYPIKGGYCMGRNRILADRILADRILAVSQDNFNVIKFDDNNRIAKRYVMRYSRCHTPDGISNFQHDDSITYASFSSDSKLIATVSQNRVVKLWNISDKPNIFSTRNEDEIISTNYYGSDQPIVALTSDNAIEFQKFDGTFISAIQKNRLNSLILGFDHKNQTFITDSYHTLLKLPQVYSNQEIPLKDSQNNINRIINTDVSPDGNLIAAASADNSIRIWHSDGTLVKSWKTDQEINDLTFSPNSQILSAIGNDNSVQLYKNNGDLIKKLPGHTEEVKKVIYSPDSKMLATIGDDNLVKLYKSNGDLIKLLIGHNARVDGIEFSPNSSQLLSFSRGFSYNDSKMNIWYSSDGKLLLPIDIDQSFSAVHFSPSGDFIIATNEYKNIIQLWNSKSQKPIATLTGNAKLIFNRDETKIASIGKEGIIRLWYVKNILTEGKFVNPIILEDHMQKVKDINFSPDGKFIDATDDDGTVERWRSDSSSEKPIKTLPVSSNDVPNIINRVDSLQFWDIKGRKFASLPVDADDVRSVTFSHNDKTIASVIDSKSVKIWDRNGKLLSTISRNNDQVNSVSFSSNDEIIATDSDDKTIKLWKVNDGKPYMFDGSNIIKATDEIKDAIFMPNEDTIAFQTDNEINFQNLHGKSRNSIQETFTNDSINILGFSSDGEKLAVYSDRDKLINLHLLNGWWQKDFLLYPVNIFFYIHYGQKLPSQTLSVTNNERTILLNIDLDDLLKRACNQASFYLKNNPNVSKDDRKLCDGY